VLTDIAQRYLPELHKTMRAVVETAPSAPGFDVMLRYPLGWVDAQGNAYANPTGKRIRPLVLLLSCEAAGGDWHAALPAAAAVEILHNFTLVHDDIQDASPKRHGRATVWKVWNRANAINVGDALFTLAYVALQGLEASVPPATVLRIWRIFNQTMLELTRGQHEDMRFESEPSVSTDEYIAMISGKTSSLLSACTEIGALVGSGDAERARHFAEFGLALGIAFQIHDDILGIWGDPKVTGKSAATDIKTRKKSLPVVYGLKNSEPLRDVYAREKFRARDVKEAVHLLDASGARQYAQAEEQAYFERAMAALDRAEPQGAAGNQLRALAVWLMERSY
jgi:geranylgeranyl diphosphate synthase type I